MDVTEIATGLWRWTAPHPEWQEGDGWERGVGCVLYEAPEATVLIDPLVPPEQEEFLQELDRDVVRRGQPVSILLTVPWHARSKDTLVKRYGACPEAPSSVEPFAVPEADETLWWLPNHTALVTGDVLLGADGGVRVCPDSWLDGSATPEAVRARLRPLLDLPIDRILPAHGSPVLAQGRGALEKALAR